MHASAILTGPLWLLYLIDENVCQPSTKAQRFSHHVIFSQLNSFLPRTYLQTRCDLERRTDLFGCFNLSSIKRINSEGNVSKTAQVFVATMRKLSKNPSAVSVVIAPGFGMTETW
jgi:hypothetical protein